MKSWIVAALLACACACPSKPATHAGTGSNEPVGSAAPVVTSNATTCDGARPKVESLYRAEAQQREPKRVDEAVSDNTTMVMNDCVKDPARFVPCLNKITTVAEMEKQCLIPLDEEGTEGDHK